VKSRRYGKASCWSLPASERLSLTGGNLYLAHTVASVERWRGRLVIVWLAVLVSSGGLVVPEVAAGLSGRKVPQVLGPAELQWAWAVLASVAHELTAAGCMLAAAARARTRNSAETSHAREIRELLAQRDAARREAAALRQPAASSAAGSAAASSSPAALSGGPWSRSPAPRMADSVACREGCGRSFDSVLAEIGHLRHCPVRQERRKLVSAVPEVAS
jgi:hypothetical protein